MQSDKGQEWKASLPLAPSVTGRIPWKGRFSRWHGAVPTGVATLGLLTEAGAVCLPRALHSARIKLQCHAINGHVFGSVRQNLSSKMAWYWFTVSLCQYRLCPCFASLPNSMVHPEDVCTIWTHMVPLKVNWVPLKYRKDLLVTFIK